MTVLTLVLHGDDDQIVPIGNTARIAVRLRSQGMLKVYPGAPHGMYSTNKEQVNADLLDSIQGELQ